MKYLFLLMALASCTDATMSQITTYGSTARILCYSGGQVILDTTSTGKIASEEHSDGWYFKDSKTGKLIRTNADCIVEN